MANLKHAGRKRKVNTSDDDKAYQKRQSKAFSQLQRGLKSLQQTPPNHLDKTGKRLWRNLAPELIKLGNVKQLDSLNLEALCTTYSVYLQAIPVRRLALTRRKQSMKRALPSPARHQSCFTRLKASQPVLLSKQAPSSPTLAKHG